MTLHEKIRDLAGKKNALILAHNYQSGAIQDVADYVGDSLELARVAASNTAEIIVFCGVHFMAESAYILSPSKKVILPDITAGCPMADMVTAVDLRKRKAELPNAKVVTYINSPADAKAESDVICTSSNAIKIVQAIDADEILFVPDRNLGSWVSRFTDKKIHLWDGCCPIHALITREEILQVKERHPDALLMVHPECSPEVIDLADEVLSTGGMVSFVKTTDRKKIIVGTESGMIHKLKKTAPSIEFYTASENFVCKNMKKTTLEKVYAALEAEQPCITVDDAVAAKARVALDTMLELSR
jgi:quinolinate synthase